MRFLKAAVRIGGFLLGLLILLFLMNQIFSPRKWYPGGYIQDRNGRTAMLSCVEPETLDIINVGDSESDTSFSPLYVWQEEGYTSANIGCDGMTIPECHAVLKKMFRTQSPRVVLIESNLLYRSSVKKIMRSTVAEPLYDIFEGLRYHNLWKYCWKDRGSRLYFQGYMINEQIGPYTGKEDYMEPTEETEDVDILNEFWLGRIRRLCIKNGAVPVLWSAPSPANYTMKKHNSLAGLSQKYGIDYIDCNLYRKEIGIDWAKDTLDGGDHLNCSGAEKTSLWLARRLKESLALTDHRAEASYAEAWDPVLERYQTMKEMMTGLHSENLPDEVRDFIQNGGDFHQPGF